MTNLDKLKDLLAELFMLDQADLDFGIYRVMNAKRAEVTRFLDHDLLPQVRTELEKISTGDRAGLETDLAKAIAAARAAGFSAEQAEQSPKVKELRAQLAANVDVSALENEVLSDLANFFRRYYSGGDFLALRRYKAGVYAIPYEGEEVKLHWANADQYYIKTSEFLRDYTFKLADGKRIHFKLIEADTEADNKKSAAGQERRFILCAADPLLETDGELVIRFEYRPDADKRKQAELNTLASETILNVPGFAAWKSALARLSPTEKNPNRTLLEKHLGDYTARNSFDYFIHKDIGGFLRRELDFYIKNEIMHLDDIEAEDAPRVGQYLAKIKAIRAIARKIIDFLEQLENFQKKLWLKKKFVVETNYCVTLDRVAEALYPEIAANDAQWQEWEKLFAISEIAPDLFNQKKQKRDAKFLKANPFLVLDTKFFPAEFKEKLLADNKILGGAATLDEATDGLLIHGDNFQALNLLQARYREQVQFIYIDPPYNTDATQIIYKNGYKESSWLTLISSRLSLGRSLLRADGVHCLTIDDYEHSKVRMLLDTVFHDDNYLATVLIRNNPSGRSTVKGFSVNHEFALFHGVDEGYTKVGRFATLQKRSTVG
jgi:adenine-specific DNA-methyltransferase